MDKYSNFVKFRLDYFSYVQYSCLWSLNLKDCLIFIFLTDLKTHRQLLNSDCSMGLPGKTIVFFRLNYLLLLISLHCLTVVYLFRDFCKASLVANATMCIYLLNIQNLKCIFFYNLQFILLSLSYIKCECAEYLSP